MINMTSEHLNTMTPEKFLLLAFVFLLQFIVLIMPSVNYPEPSFSNKQLGLIEAGLVVISLLIIFFI